MTGRIWAVDVEGNGASPPEIVELAVVAIDDLELNGRPRLWRFKPKQPISPIASRIHGITDSDLVDAPEIEDVADDVIELLGSAPIVGHNVRVDHELLQRALINWVPDAAYDTLSIARNLLPDEKKYGLQYLGESMGLNVEASLYSKGRSAHSALYDAALCALLLRKMLSPLAPSVRLSLLDEADILRKVQGTLL